MDDAAPGGAGRRRWLPLALVLLGVALLLATRAFHRIPGLGNADIAGILYEADIIRDGGVPYRDTMDMKSPGTWFLFAAIFRFVAREIWAVHAVFVAWCLLAAPAVWLAARALYAQRVIAAAAVLLYLAAVGLFDLNYSAWMTTPYAWSFACLIVGLRAARWSWAWHVLGGVFAAVAVVFKPHAFVLAPTFILVWWWARRRGEAGAQWSAWPLWLLGALLGLAPLLLWYAYHGALPALIAGLFPFQIAREYGERSLGDTWWVWRAGKVPLQLVAVFPLHATLGVAAVIACGLARRAGRSCAPLAPSLIFLGWSVLGCGVGGLRFYIHYLPQYLPALALLAVHPDGLAFLRGGLRRGLPWRARLVPGVLAATCAVLVAVLTIQIPLGKAARVDHKGNPQARLAGAYIAAHSEPEDRVQVWGWAAWSVYFWADRRAPSPVFKVLGQVTDYNQNGLFSRSHTADFRPGPAADALLAAFASDPPAFFVRTFPFFPGVREDPLEQWPALKKIFAEQYVMRKRFGKIRVYELRSRVSPDELEAAKREALTRPLLKRRGKTKAKPAKVLPKPPVKTP